MDCKTLIAAKIIFGDMIHAKFKNILGSGFLLCLDHMLSGYKLYRITLIQSPYITVYKIYKGRITVIYSSICLIL